MLNEPLKPMLLQPMLPSQIKKDFKSSLKWDGFRILIHYNHGAVRAFTRHGTEVTSRFPELNNIKLPVKTAILDGECIAFDLTQAKDQPPKLWWDDAMTRFNTKKESAVKQIAKTLRAHFPLWDILFLDGKPMLNSSFMQRREALEDIVDNSETLSITPLYNDGEELFLKAKELGLEGIVQYHPDAQIHLNTRSKNMIKVKAYQYITCQISSVRLVGGFGWGLTVDGKYVGLLEFPPNSKAIRAFNQVSKQLVTHEHKGWRYIEPVLGCKIKFQCFTKDGKLRSPKFEEFITITSV
ncbi:MULTISPECIES: DNA ligase [unclassified Paenibacillus]|uniref:DNA ligase n=1 Tax=Paenibacillus provencensis TaxID=441151 RepID=A0ABW3QID2_9BACL|nr:MULTISPECIES: DNA ligase [unclassified Paenibacillus]MCM3130238.1 DNA ligase [Paenibacillus sp. MER 78]SDX72310.1 bifunctional non-homologous end joining protein LigD/DNA ligase-1 [Paenibacillus sp. PDC88]SFS89247.1 DNA ligase-1 [Paenibacillus sp. 453mf]